MNFDKAKIKLKDLEGHYDNSLVEELKMERVEVIAGLGETQRENPDFMEPLLYAMINEYNSYEIYKHCGPKLKGLLQGDLQLSTEIVINAPELIVDSPLASDKTLILTNVEKNPEIVKYISPSLDNDQAFLKELTSTNNSQVIEQAAEKYSEKELLMANPELGKDEQFMMQAIARDITIVQYADSEVLNKYTEILKETTEKDVMEVIDENIEKGADERFSKVKSFLTEKGENCPHKMKVLAASFLLSETKEPDKLKELLDFSMASMTRLQRMLHDNPEYSIGQEDLLPPGTVRRLLEVAKEQSIEHPMEQHLEEYVEFYQEVVAEKRQNTLNQEFESKKEVAEKNGMEVIDENIEKDADPRFGKVKDFLTEKGDNYPAKMKIMSAMFLKSEEKSPDMLKQYLDFAMASMLRLDNMLRHNNQIGKDDVSELIAPNIVRDLADELQQLGLEHPMQKQVEKYSEFYKGALSKVRENVQVQEHQQSEKSEPELTDLQKAITGYNSREAYQQACNRAENEWNERSSGLDRGIEINVER